MAVLKAFNKRTRKWEPVSGPAVELSDAPGAQAYNSTTQSLATGTETPLTLNTEDFDTDAYHSGTTNTSRMTIPAGRSWYYHVTAQTFSPAAAGSKSLKLSKNGTAVKHSGDATASIGEVLTIDWTGYLAAGDHIELLGWHNCTGSQAFGHASERQWQTTLTLTAQVAGTPGPRGYPGPRQGPSRVTSLPASPVNGEEVAYVADGSIGALWHLRWNGTYWEALGGSPLRVEGVGGRDNSTRETTTSTTATTLTTAGPSITVPLAGIYDIWGSAGAYGVNQGAASIFLWLSADGSQAWNRGDATGYAAADHYDELSARRQRTLAANEAVQMKYATSNVSYAVGFWNRNLYVMPVRIG